MPKIASREQVGCNATQPLILDCLVVTIIVRFHVIPYPVCASLLRPTPLKSEPVTRTGPFTGLVGWAFVIGLLVSNPFILFDFSRLNLLKNYIFKINKIY